MKLKRGATQQRSAVQVLDKGLARGQDRGQEKDRARDKGSVKGLNKSSDRGSVKNRDKDRRTRSRTPQAGDARESRRRADAQSRKSARRPAELPPRAARPPETRALQRGPATTPIRKPAPPKNASQAKARAKARKAKAPKVIRVPLRVRLVNRIAAIDLNPRSLAARVPFVVLVIGALGLGLGVTLWLSTDAAERSYQLGTARATNRELLQKKEALERDVLEAQAAPALAEAARNLGMIPSRDTAHLVQDPTGNWIVVGDPKPAEGVPPPPLNAKLPDDKPAPPQAPANTTERPVLVPTVPTIPVIPGPTSPAVPLAAAPEVPQVMDHAPAGAPTPPGPVTGLDIVPVAPPAPVDAAAPAAAPPGPVDAAAPPAAPPPPPADVPAPAVPLAGGPT